MDESRITRLGGPVGSKLTGRSARDRSVPSGEGNTTVARAESFGLSSEIDSLSKVRGTVIAKGLLGGASDSSTSRTLRRAENLFTGGGDYSSVIGDDKRSAMQRTNDLSRAAFTYKYAPAGGYNGSKDDQWNAVSKARQDVMDYSGGVKLAHGTFEAKHLERFEGDYQDEAARRNKAPGAAGDEFARSYNRGTEAPAGEALSRQSDELLSELDAFRDMDRMGALGPVGQAGYKAAMELTSSKLSEDSADLTGLMNTTPGDTLGPRIKKALRPDQNYVLSGGLH